MKPKTYWKQYDFLYKNHSKKSMYKTLKRIAKKLGQPYKKKDPRGNKLKFSSIEYASFTCLQKIFRHRYRDMELEATLYLPEKADHSTFARNYAKIPEHYIESLIILFVQKEFCYWIADSTGISTKIRVERIRQGTRNKEKLRDKFHTILGYDPPTSATFVLSAKATDNACSDSKAAIDAVKNRESTAYFFGDSAYHTYELQEVLKENGFFAVIKPTKIKTRKPMSSRAKAEEKFSKGLYRGIRGVGETIYGGATNAGLILTYAKKEHTRRLDTLIIALRHNLFASLRFVLVICATNSANNKHL